MSINNVFAKSSENGGTLLIDHCIETMNVAKDLCKKEQLDGDITATCLISSAWHDLGKLHHFFQKKLKQPDFNNQGYTHNILSAKIFYERIGVDGIEISKIEELIANMILHHHPVGTIDSEIVDGSFFGDDSNLKYVNDSDKELAEEFVDVLIHKCNEALESIGCVARLKRIDKRGTYGTDFSDDVSETNKNKKNRYQNDKNNKTDKTFKYFSKEHRNLSCNHILQYCEGVLRFADVVASSGGSIENYTKMRENFVESDFVCPQKYDKKRFEKQKKAAIEMSEKILSVLIAKTSFGKTLIGLIWGLLNGRKLIWVCPTNAIATSTYDSIKRELSELGLLDKVKVGLLLTNKWVYDDGDGSMNDIIVTNIDNYARPIFKSDGKKHLSYNIVQSNVIFDEFQQYATSNAIMATFITSMRARCLSKNNRTLLLSATPNKKLYDYLERDFKGLEIYEKEVNSDDIDNRKFRISYSEKHNDGDTLVIRNSVRSSQNVYKKIQCDSNNKMIFHSRFIKEHNKDKVKRLIESHGKNGTNKELTVCATNIATTSFDVSFSRLELSVLPIYEIIQAAGRGNRHSSNEDDICDIVIDESSLSRKDNKSETNALETKYNYDLVKIEFDMFKKRFKDGDIVRLSDLYDFYYYTLPQNNEYNSKYKEYFEKIRRTSFEYLSKIRYRYATIPLDDGKERISEQIYLRDDGTNCNVFIRCEDGMEDGWYMQYEMIKRETYNEYSMNMYKYIKNHNLENVYYVSSEENKSFKKLYDNKDREKLAEKYIEKAKISDTPFILPSAEYCYDIEYGLLIVK